MAFPVLLVAATSIAICGALTTVSARADDRPVTLSLGLGLADIRAEERVYHGDRKVSHLDWRSTGVTVLRGAASIDLGRDWSLNVEAKAGLNGNGHMVDYDWVSPYFIDQSKNGWSHRSIHDDTDLDHYYSGSFDLTRLLLDTGGSKLSAGLGGRYTDVQWTANGGSLIYSAKGRRNISATIADGTRGITYRQTMPVVYATLGGAQTLGQFVFSGSLEAGAVISGQTDDDHWLRKLHFTDRFTPAPSFGIKAAIDYKLTETTALYINGSFESTRFRRGDTHVSHTVSGEFVDFPDTAGGSFATMLVGFGVKGSF